MKNYQVKGWVGILLFVWGFYVPILSFAQDNTTYKRVYLSGKDAANTVNWDFKVTEGQNSGQWTTIPLPSNWELQGFGKYNYGHDHNKKGVTLGKEHGLYQYQFKVPAAWKGKSVNIVFDGSMTDT
jgi:hypothetical protein